MLQVVKMKSGNYHGPSMQVCVQLYDKYPGGAESDFDKLAELNFYGGEVQVLLHASLMAINEVANRIFFTRELPSEIEHTLDKYLQKVEYRHDRVEPKYSEYYDFKQFRSLELTIIGILNSRPGDEFELIHLFNDLAITELHWLIQQGEPVAVLRRFGRRPAA